MQFTPHSGGLEIKSKGCFGNRKPSLTNFVFRLKFSDFTFRSYKRLKFAKNHYIFFFFSVRFWNQDQLRCISYSDAGEKRPKNAPEPISETSNDYSGTESDETTDDDYSD